MRKIFFGILAVIAFILSILILCVVDSESVLHLWLLFGAVFALWSIVLLGFSAEARKFVRKTISGIYATVAMGIAAVIRKIKERNSKPLEQEFELINEKTNEDYERCYCIAVDGMVNRIIAEENKKSMMASA